MARKPKGEDKARLLRALAFQIHRKQAPDDVLLEHVESESQRGNRREVRAAHDALTNDGFAAGLLALDLIGEEAADLLDVIVQSGDHRLISAVVNRLADRYDAN